MGAASALSAHFAPWIRLVSPTGAARVYSSPGQGASDIGASAPTIGTYTVIVASYLFFFNDTAATEIYTLALHDALPIFSNGDEGGPMTDGATYAGNIYQGDFDKIGRAASRGRENMLGMAASIKISAHFAPWIRLVSPTGVLLGNSSTGQGASGIAATASTSGTYTVIVASYLSGYYDGTGGYLLTLAQGPGAVVVSNGDEGGPMTNGATYAGNIYQGDFDTWTFTATQGDYIALSMGAVSPISAHFAPWIRLVSPTGALLGNSSTGQGAADIAATAAPKGTRLDIIHVHLTDSFFCIKNYLLTLAQ